MKNPDYPAKLIFNVKKLSPMGDDNFMFERLFQLALQHNAREGFAPIEVIMRRFSNSIHLDRSLFIYDDELLHSRLSYVQAHVFHGIPFEEMSANRHSIAFIGYPDRRFISVGPIEKCMIYRIYMVCDFVDSKAPGVKSFTPHELECMTSLYEPFE